MGSARNGGLHAPRRVFTTTSLSPLIVVLAAPPLAALPLIILLGALPLIVVLATLLLK
jgi:hypothetical protein